MSLSSRQQQILAGIENELGEDDPALAATLTQARPPESFSAEVRFVATAAEPRSSGGRGVRSNDVVAETSAR